MRLLRRLKDPQAFDALLAPLSTAPLVPLPLSTLGRRYYPATRSAEEADETFLVEEAGQALAVVELDVQEKRLGRFGFPFEIRVAPDLPSALARRMVREIFGRLEELAQPVQGAAHLRTCATIPTDPLITAHCVARGFVPGVELRAVADLSLSAEELTADMRQGHRQQVKWGAANLRLEVVGAANPSRAGLEAMRDFHAQVAGRVTRPAASWEVMFEALAAGQAELLLGYLDADLVAASLIMDAGDTAFYASGVYDRARFDLPIAHFMVFSAIQRARQRGLRFFDVGVVPLAGPDVSEKEVNIGTFKRGFTSRLVRHALWRRDAPQ